MLVEEIMIRKPETVTPEDTVRTALEKLAELDARHLPVVEEGKLVGIISDRDLRSLSIELASATLDPARARKRLETKVRDIMHTDVISVHPGTELTEVIDTFVEAKVGALPIVDEHSDRLVGIVSYIDVMKAARPLFG